MFSGIRAMNTGNNSLLIVRQIEIEISLQSCFSLITFFSLTPLSPLFYLCERSGERNIKVLLSNVELLCISNQ